MTEKNLQQFCELVLRDVGLQKKLMNFIDREEFLNEVLKTGAELGFIFSHDDVRALMRDNKRLWNERWM